MKLRWPFTYKNIFVSFHVKMCAKNGQVATFLRGEDPSVGPQGHKTPLRPCHSSKDFGLYFWVWAHIIIQNLFFNEFISLSFLWHSKMWSKRQIFCCRVQYCVLRHTLYAANHELWRHADYYGFLSSWRSSSASFVMYFIYVYLFGEMRVPLQSAEFPLSIGTFSP